jgi:hypothetical protein
MHDEGAAFVSRLHNHRVKEVLLAVLSKVLCERSKEVITLDCTEANVSPDRDDLISLCTITIRDQSRIHGQEQVEEYG